MNEFIGRAISHYTIVDAVGQGAMGVVYRADDTRLKRVVALKFLPAEISRDPDAKDRFIREAQAASALQHNNICTVHDIDQTADGQMFIVMDLYSGETLEHKLRKEPLPMMRQSTPQFKSAVVSQRPMNVASSIVT
jgi:serine/threonine protein kinase